MAAVMDMLPFAATKIQPPHRQRGGRHARLTRPALEADLAAALTRSRVVVLQAPAGFGKTSLLAAMLGALPEGTPLAWVSMDEDDDDQRFFGCLTAALEPWDLPWRTAPEALAVQLGNEGPQSPRPLAELINALAGVEAALGVIVLDDLHRVDQRGVFALLEGLIERLPAQWVVVLSSRVLPPLPLPRWRAMGELTVFDQERLAFSAEEAKAFAEREGAGERASELFERTRGWPAGLRLLLAGRGGAAAGAGTAVGRDVFDFLASEVLDDMPLALHDFLLRTAVLPELTTARAAAVSGDARAAERLDEIERRGLFATALDADERTLVLHDLFREALLDRLRRRWPGEEAVLLRRAAESESDPVRRVGFLLRSRDWAAAETALATHAPEMLLAGGLRELQRLIDQFDAGWREHSPRLHRLAGMVSTLRWQWEPMAAQMRAAAAAARRLGHQDELDLAEAYLAGALYPLDFNTEGEALIAALRSRPTSGDARRLTLMADCSQHLRRGQMAELPALYGEVLQLLEARPDLFAWWECVPPFNWTTVSGMKPLIERYVRGALARIEGRPLPMRADVHLLRAFGLLWSGRIDEAAAEATAVEDDTRWLACTGEVEVGVHIFRLVEGAIHGRAEVVAGRLQQLFVREDAAAEEQRRVLWRHHMAIYGVRMSDVLGGEGVADEIARWSAHLKENPLADAGAGNHRAVTVRARHAAAQGRWAEAAEGFSSLLPRLPSIDVMGRAIELRLRAAHALLQCGRLDEAADALRPALQRVLEEGERGQTLLAGPAVLATLADARWGPGIAAPLLDELRAAAELAALLRGAPRSPATAAPMGGDPGGEGLSQREREVLALLAEGSSNKLIARALDISPHTVKRHVANILDKLGLGSRGQAAAWWHEQA